MFYFCRLLPSFTPKNDPPISIPTGVDKYLSESCYNHEIQRLVTCKENVFLFYMRLQDFKIISWVMFILLFYIYHFLERAIALKYLIEFSS